VGQFGVILLDTHVVLWLISDPARLSPNARATIEETRSKGEGLAICDITLLELATLAGKGRINVAINLETLLRELEHLFTVLPISAEACARSAQFPAGYPNDPADRIIGATALVEGLTLLTADREIRRSNVVRTVW
jgi:PIN domain nuclease of toxin-antitoxin system